MSVASGTSRTSVASAKVAAPVRAPLPQLRPYALLLLFLSVSLALWGFGCKLSRYNPHPNVTSRTLSAKLWDKHQDLEEIAGRLKVSGNHSLPITLALALVHAARPAQNIFPLPSEQRAAHPVLVCRAAIPLRSPPSHPFQA